jgi:hypothetical protein
MLPDVSIMIPAFPFVSEYVFFNEDNLKNAVEKRIKDMHLKAISKTFCHLFSAL